MKKIFILAVLSLICASTAYAQIHVEAGYISEKKRVKIGKASATTNALTGFTIGASYVFEDVAFDNHIIEAGLSFASMSGDGDSARVVNNVVTLPINFGYNIKINKSLTIRPFAGIGIKYNINLKNGDENWYSSPKRFEYDKKNHLQANGQIGALVQVQKFTLSYQFQHDISGLVESKTNKKVEKYIKHREFMFNHSVKIGYNF